MSEIEEFARLRRRVDRLIEKCDKKGIEMNDIELSAISRIGHAKSIHDVSWLVIQTIERTLNKYKVR
ncbi:hypothetical protein ACSHUI_00350 [Bacillus subtilis]|uniref:hypothetical protein n=1 Tax=Bacillus subtilis TaxID=1423 RepID=UPI003CFA1D44